MVRATGGKRPSPATRAIDVPVGEELAHDDAERLRTDDHHSGGRLRSHAEEPPPSTDGFAPGDGALRPAQPGGLDAIFKVGKKVLELAGNAPALALAHESLRAQGGRPDRGRPRRQAFPSVRGGPGTRGVATPARRARVAATAPTRGQVRACAGEEGREGSLPPAGAGVGRQGGRGEPRAHRLIVPESTTQASGATSPAMYSHRPRRSACSSADSASTAICARVRWRRQWSPASNWTIAFESRSGLGAAFGSRAFGMASSTFVILPR